MKNFDIDSLPMLDEVSSKWRRGFRGLALLGLLPATSGLVVLASATLEPTHHLVGAATLATGILGITSASAAVFFHRAFQRSWYREFLHPVQRLLATIALLDSRDFARLPEGRQASFTADYQKRLQELARTFLEHRSFIDLVFDGVSEAVFLLDPDGVVLRANKAAVRVTGFAMEQLVGEHLRKILVGSENLVDPFLALEVRLTTSGEVHDHETTLLTAEGKPVRCSLHGAKVETPAGDLIGFTLIAKEVNETFRSSSPGMTSDSTTRPPSPLAARGLPLPLATAKHPDIIAAEASVHATYCGGDWWNTLSTRSRYYVLVGSISAQGTPAAMAIAAVSGYYVSVRDALMAGRDVDVDGILAGFDAVLKAMAADDVSYSMTCSACMIDFERGVVRVANAGHASPIFCRAGRCESLAASGAPLGTRVPGSYETTEFPFQDGDLLVSFTDGLIANSSHAGEPFGRRRVERHIESHPDLPVAHLVQNLVREATDFVGGEKGLDDDMTVVAVRMCGSGKEMT